MAIKEVFIFLLFVELVVCDRTDNKCPSRVENPDCNCWELSGDVLNLLCGGYRTGKSLEEYSKVLQKTLSGRRNIKLYNSLFTAESRLPSRVFDGLDIKYLRIAESNVTRWADVEGGPAFVGLEDTLETLEIQDSFAKFRKTCQEGPASPAQLTLGHLRKLREVKYHDNLISTLGNDWFENGPNSLEIVDISNCRTEILGDRAFANLPNLKRVKVAFNEVEKLTRSMFPNPANHLEAIALMDNKLSYLPDDIFTNMPELRVINIFGNLFTHLPETTWGAVWSRLDYMNVLFMKIVLDKELDWIFKQKPPKSLIGDCFERINLKELIEEKQREGK